MKTAVVLAAAMLAPAICAPVQAQDHVKLDERVKASTGILHELAGVPDKGIPDGIAKKAHCVIVIPSFKKGAFIGGVEYGQGIATCYVAHKGWSAPAFVQMTGVSFGLQAGGEGTDLVLVGVSKESGDRLLKDKFKLGGDVAVAAGPVGRDSKAETTALANAGFLTYSRNKGLFAGIDLNGDEVHKNSKDTREFYGRELPYETILNGGVPVPGGAKAFIAEVTRVFGGPAVRHE
jgi:SH3 domain-containing YSC84-like protein 1